LIDLSDSLVIEKAFKKLQKSSKQLCLVTKKHALFSLFDSLKSKVCTKKMHLRHDFLKIKATLTC
jgi:hypothetical protein